MIKYLSAYVWAGIAFLAVDSVWLTQVGPHLYRPTLDAILAEQVNLAAAGAFYAVYVLGMTLLVISRAGSVRSAGVNGALLGAVAYATYDLTNQATLRVWSTNISLADIGWGTFVTGVACIAGYLAWRTAGNR